MLVAVATTVLIRAQYFPPPLTAGPGSMGDGSTLLPNGWRLAPAGKHLQLSTLPLNIVVSPDGRQAVITNNGLSRPTLNVVDISTWAIKTTMPMDHTWLGLVFHPDGTKLYASGAGQNSVQEFSYADGVVTRVRTLALPAHSSDTMVGGLAIAPNGRTLFATRVFAMTVSRIDLSNGQVTHTAALPVEPYSCVLSPDGRILYVSLWGGSRIRVYDADSLYLLGEWASGEHPNAMAISSDGKRLFVACASSASVWVYDTFAGEPIEQISTSLGAQAPPTATPNSVALSPDGRTLIVANADNNAVAVVDVGNPARSFVEGFIPTGWYPTGAVFSKDGKQILILSGKGLLPSANLNNGGMERRMVGAVSIVTTPDRGALADYTRRVMSLTPYTDAIRMNPNVPIGSPIPRTVGGVSPIKHVFYVIRENRTYDQVLGDLPEGNGDPKLTIFGRDITPNGHALAQTFVLFDNFFVDADVSYNGHSYSTAAYATDFIEKTWQTLYARAGSPYLAEGGGLLRNPFGNISAPPGGYIWDYARRANVSVRSYGEFVDHVYTGPGPNHDVIAVEAVPGLAGLVSPAYAGWDLEVTDNKRIDVWLQEFRQFERDGKLPQLSIIRLPNDHTAGARPGAPTPRAMVAENDVALGRLVEAISNSVYWKESAIFAVEDDAQAGPDHVDSHRSVLLVASPFVKRAAVDHTFYSTASVLRTIELILGLPPMSTYDAAATPMHAAFTGTPNVGAFRRFDARVSLDEKNPTNAFGAIASLQMNFSEADRTPEVLLNDIIWRSVKGAHSPMPPPRRSLFITPASRAADDDDDDIW
ncbi:MAG TPA: alkaline phosphatase family protein [Vicinamibacterales bacterium]|nr:alkaline phosphatase family protein [Vicinamibacterales bacterium]